MAEFANGNFLGEDATYPEWLNSWFSNKRFPFPSLRSTTDGTLPTSVSDTSNAINNAHIKPMLDQNGHTIGNGLYLEKVKDGIHVDYHSAVLYSLVHNRKLKSIWPILRPTQKSGSSGSGKLPNRETAGPFDLMVAR